MGNLPLTGLFSRSEKCTPNVFAFFISLHFYVIKFQTARYRSLRPRKMESKKPNIHQPSRTQIFDD